jgi:hypothetical protein
MADPPPLSSVTRKVIWRLLPFMMLLYLVNYVDRANVGYAATRMNSELGLSAAAFGLGAGIFYLGYMLFEVPSNILLHKVGARILYLTYWLPRRPRVFATSLFVLAIPLSNVVAAPISLPMVAQPHILGITGWRFMFLAECIPAIVLGVVTLFWLTSRPEQATWLSRPEKEVLGAALDAEAAETTRTVRHSVARLAWGWHSRRTGEATWHVALPMFVAGISTSAALYMSSARARDRGDIGDRGGGLLRDPGVLAASLGVSHRDGGRGGHRADQHDRCVQQLRRPLSDGLAARLDRQLPTRDVRDRRLHGARRHPRASPAPGHRPTDPRADRADLAVQLGPRPGIHHRGETR